MVTLEKPAETVDAYCKKCSAVVAHAVLTVRSKRISRVRCLSCDDAHPYRVKAPTSKKPKKRAAKLKGAQAEELSYERMAEEHDLTQSTRYLMTQTFKDREVIDHKRFGIGMVVRVLMDGKIMVLFPDGMKLLVHGR